MAGELITADNQAQFGDLLLMGAGSPYVITAAGIEGWEDLPGFASTNVPKPSGDGAWTGRRYAGTRLVTIPVSVHPDRDPLGRSGRELLRALQLATPLHGPEEPLVIRILGESLLCWARINARVSKALSTQWMALGETDIPLQFEATDPRRYGLEERSALAGAPVRSEGLQYAAVSGTDRIDYVAVGGVDRFDWGVDGSGGDIPVVNAGTASTRPLIVFAGPCVTPSVTVDGLGLVLEYDIELTAGETLTVDTRESTVLLNGSASRSYLVTPRSSLLEDFELPPGESLLSFRVESGTDPSSMTVRWRDAYL